MLQSDQNRIVFPLQEPVQFLHRFPDIRQRDLHLIKRIAIQSTYQLRHYLRNPMIQRGAHQQPARQLSGHHDFIRFGPFCMLHVLRIQQFHARIDLRAQRFNRQHGQNRFCVPGFRLHLFIEQHNRRGGLVDVRPLEHGFSGRISPDEENIHVVHRLLFGLRNDHNGNFQGLRIRPQLADNVLRLKIPVAEDDMPLRLDLLHSALLLELPLEQLSRNRRN